MTAQSHTTGPRQNGMDDLEGVVSLGAQDDGNVICLPPSARMEASLSRWDANARLIAAAPDLLAAVWSLVEHFERVDGDERHRAVIDQATAAIAKATGDAGQ